MPFKRFFLIALFFSKTLLASLVFSLACSTFSHSQETFSNCRKLNRVIANKVKLEHIRFLWEVIFFWRLGHDIR